MTVIKSTPTESTPRDPENTLASVGGAYNTGTNPSPGGDLDIVDAMPLEDRSDGTSDNAVAQSESLARQGGLPAESAG